jgi:hypothetical protein
MSREGDRVIVQRVAALFGQTDPAGTGRAVAAVFRPATRILGIGRIILCHRGRQPAVFRSLTEALDTTIAQGRLVFHMFGALAEFERSLIRERTQAGLAAARTGGRPPKLADDDIEAAKAMLANPDIGVTQIAHRLGVSPATLYRYIPAARTANTSGV